MTRVIFHIDMDAFYPSAEKLKNPALRGLPVIVGADPKGGKGRGVVVSCSYEARRFGVRSGQPISQAYKLCPNAVYIRPDFSTYVKISEEIMSLLKKYADKFEQVSIDEAFMDVTRRVEVEGGSKELAMKMKEELYRELGLTCSIGVAPNKSTAKIASGEQKPNGLTILQPDRVKTFLSTLPVERIAGVGPKTRALLKGVGIETIGQLADYPPKQLVKHLGKNGVWLWAIANGTEQVEVEESHEIKSLSVNHTFEEDVKDRKVILGAFEELAEELHDRLIAENLNFKTVGIIVRFEGFATFTREKTLPSYSDRKDIMIKIALSLFREFESDRRRIRMIGLRVSHMKQNEAQQRTLKSWTAR